MASGVVRLGSFFPIFHFLTNWCGMVISVAKRKKMAPIVKKNKTAGGWKARKETELHERVTESKEMCE
jgi:hypothetical protein